MPQAARSKPATVVIAVGPPGDPEAHRLALELRVIARTLARARGLRIRTRSV